MTETSHAVNGHTTTVPQIVWDALTQEDQLDEILQRFPPASWVREPAIGVLAACRQRPIPWAQIALTWAEKAPFLSFKLLEEAVDSWRKAFDVPREERQKKRREPPPPNPELPPGDWQQSLLVTGSGEPKATINNVCLLLEHAAPWRDEFWYDAVRGVSMVGDYPLDDALLMVIERWLGDTCRMALSNMRMVEHCAVTMCQRRVRDLLQEWLETLPPWDGTERLEHWLTHVAGAVDGPYTRDVSRLLPVSMVARALTPGCQYRYVVLLEGAENTGKSTLVRTLASPTWFYECTGGLEGKEAYMAIQGKWVAELPELHAMTRTEENRFKGFISQRQDTWIPKFSNFTIEKPRRTIFVGTLNPEGNQEYLRGQTGNTRYLPLKVGVTGKIDPALLAQWRDQLFAEALVYLREQPDTWWQLSGASEAEVVLLREDRRVTSVYEDDLAEWLEYKKVTSWRDIARDYLHLDPAAWKDKSLQMQVAQALGSLGWKNKTVRDGTKTYKKWFAPEPQIPGLLPGEERNAR